MLAPEKEFRALWVAEALSVVGDQLAKVAVAVAVFTGTGSAALTAGAYALTLVPTLLAGTTLAWLADRHPRRQVMAVCHTGQAATIALVAVPGIPLGVLAAGVVVVAAAQSMVKAAQGVLVHEVLGTDHTRGRIQLGNIREVGQIGGLAVGGAVVAWTGVPTALLADAVSFLTAAALVQLGTTLRPATPTAGHASEPKTEEWRRYRADSVGRLLMFYLLLVGLTAVPDGVIVPWVSEMRAPTWAIGVLLAADCVGVLASSMVLKRLSPPRQRAAIGLMAVAGVLPLLGFGLRPTPLVAGVLLVASGAGRACVPIMGSTIVERAPARIRSAVYGRAQSVLRAGQGVCALAGGMVAQWVGSSATAIAAAGAVGVVATVACLRPWQRAIAGGDPP